MTRIAPNRRAGRAIRIGFALSALVALMAFAAAPGALAQEAQETPPAPAVPAKPDLLKITKDCYEAIIRHEAAKAVAFFTEDVVYEVDGSKIAGAEALQDLFEYDTVDQAQLALIDYKLQDPATVVGHTSQLNESMKLLDIPADFAKVTLTFTKEGKIARVVVETSPESQDRFAARYEPFQTWAQENHPEEYFRVTTGGYNAENAKLLLSLLREWRGKEL